MFFTNSVFHQLCVCSQFQYYSNQWRHTHTHTHTTLRVSVSLENPSYLSPTHTKLLMSCDHDQPIWQQVPVCVLRQNKHTAEHTLPRLMLRHTGINGAKVTVHSEHYWGKVEENERKTTGDHEFNHTHTHTGLYFTGWSCLWPLTSATDTHTAAVSHMLNAHLHTSELNYDSN